MKIGKMAYLALIAAFAGLIGFNSDLMADSHTGVSTGAMAPDVMFTDINGVDHKISDFKGKTVVLEWHNPECPFVKKFYKNGDMPKFQKEALSHENVVWIAVNSSGKGKQGHFETTDAAKAYLAEKSSMPTAYVIDEMGKFGHAFGAKTTPHMFVIDAEGKVAYQGAIDDKASADSADIAEANNYVMAALMDLKAGNAVQKATTKSYGCSIKYVK